MFDYTSRQPRAQAAQAIDRHIKDVWEILRLSSNVLKCNKKIHSAQLTCVVPISCVYGAFGGDLAAREARKNVFALKDEVNVGDLESTGSYSSDHKSREI